MAYRLSVLTRVSDGRLSSVLSISVETESVNELDEGAIIRDSSGRSITSGQPTEAYAVTFVAARMLGLTVRCAVSVLVFERAAHVQAFLVVR